MNTPAVSSTTNQTNHNNPVVGTHAVPFPNLALLGTASKYLIMKETVYNTNRISRTKRMKLWHQPSVHPTVRKAYLKGEERTEQVEKRATLTFSEDVMVFEVPSHRDYSPEDKALVWTGMKEISKNARRNHSEFDLEGEDWRTVVEEDAMFEDAETGELIHPCWVDPSEFEDFSDDEDSVVSLDPYDIEDSDNDNDEVVSF